MYSFGYVFFVGFQAGHLHLVKPYMVAVQSNNVSAVNEALNGIYVEEEDYDRLRESIDMHDNFDQIGLAQKVEYNFLRCNCFSLWFYALVDFISLVGMCLSRLRNTSFLR